MPELSLPAITLQSPVQGPPGVSPTVPPISVPRMGRSNWPTSLTPRESFGIRLPSTPTPILLPRIAVSAGPTVSKLQSRTLMPTPAPGKAPPLPEMTLSSMTVFLTSPTRSIASEPLPRSASPAASVPIRFPCISTSLAGFPVVLDATTIPRPELPEIKFPSLGSGPPTLVPLVSSIDTPVPFGSAAVPAWLVPIRLPVRTVPVVVARDRRNPS